VGAPEWASWYPRDGVAAIGPTGSTLFVHGTYLLWRCPGNITSGVNPGIGRVGFSP
jgi:hypothetical protein